MENYTLRKTPVSKNMLPLSERHSLQEFIEMHICFLSVCVYTCEKEFRFLQSTEEGRRKSKEEGVARQILRSASKVMKFSNKGRLDV